MELSSIEPSTMVSQKPQGALDYEHSLRVLLNTWAVQPAVGCCSFVVYLKNTTNAYEAGKFDDMTIMSINVDAGRITEFVW